MPSTTRHISTEMCIFMFNQKTCTRMCVVAHSPQVEIRQIHSLNRFGGGNGIPLQYSRLENPMDGGAWWAVVHGVTKSWTRLNDFTFNFHFHALEKATATHSSVLAWRSPWAGEPGGLPSMVSHRVGHN